MKDSSPRLHYGGRVSVDAAAPMVMELYSQGVGPLSIAVRLGVNARVVMRILASSGVSTESEPQCYRLSEQMLP